MARDRRPWGRLASIAVALPLWAVASGGVALADTSDAGAPADAGSAEAIVDAASAPADPALVEAVAAARAELSALVAFSAQRLASLPSTQLFRVDLRSDDAVAKLLADVRRDLGDARLAARGAREAAAERLDAGADGGDGDAGAKERDAWLLEGEIKPETLLLLRVRVLEERERVLALPKARRLELLTAEKDAARGDAVKKEREQAEREAEQAEEERIKALQAAQQARSTVERKLAEARAHIEATRREQLRAQADLAERRLSLSNEESERAGFLAEAEQSVRGVVAGTPEADKIYDSIVEDLASILADEGALLTEIERGARAPRPDTPIVLPDATGTDLAVERDRLRDLAANVESEATRLDAEMRTLVWSSLRTLRTVERRMNELRIGMLEQITPAKRDRVLGFGEEGLAQGLREIDHLRFELRWLRASGAEIARETLADLRRPAAIARMSFQALVLIGIAWATIVARRRHRVWLFGLRNLAARATRRPSVLRMLQRGTAAIEAVGKETVTLGILVFAGAIPELGLRDGSWGVAYVLVLWYAIYRLALTTTHRVLSWLSGRGEVVATAMTSDKILRSVRLVGRAAFFFAVLLASSRAVVGKGYIHGLVVRVAWLLGFVISAVLVRRWRDDIADAYLRVRPSGTLSRLVSQTRKRWAGFFIVLAAFGFVVAAWVARALRRFVLGFEQSRKALAYLFRRRLEKQVEHAPIERPVLSDDMLAFFAETPVEDDALVIDRHPGLSEVTERVARWRSGERFPPALVVGRTGFGKTSWLLAARARIEAAEVRSIELRERATRPADIVALVRRELDAPSTVDSPETLVQYLRDTPRQVIMVDDAQMLFLRGVGRLEGWRTFARIVKETSDNVAWIVAFAHYPWEFVDWTAKGDHVFGSITHLTPWSEAEISELLRQRTDASKLAIAYDDLLVEDVGGDVSAQILTTARDYNRLIWDYAEGSPRVALHVWGRSLVPDGPGRARVRLFSNPDASVLEGLSESAKLVLAAVVWHERLSLEEAVSVSLASRMSCESAFERLIEHGVVEAHGRYIVVTPQWWPVVVRYLRRKHLIET